MGQKQLSDADNHYKHPSAVTAKTLRWYGALGDDTIDSATTEVSPSGLTVGSTAVDGTGKMTTSQFSGGTHGQTYVATVLATTAGGLILAYQFKVIVKDLDQS